MLEGGTQALGTLESSGNNSKINTEYSADKMETEIMASAEVEL